MTKVIEINHCYECPHLGSFARRVCKKTPYIDENGYELLRPIDTFPQIPGWCPLEQKESELRPENNPDGLEPPDVPVCERCGKRMDPLPPVYRGGEKVQQWRCFTCKTWTLRPTHSTESFKLCPDFEPNQKRADYEGPFCVREYCTHWVGDRGYVIRNEVTPEYCLLKTEEQKP